MGNPCLFELCCLSEFDGRTLLLKKIHINDTGLDDVAKLT